MPGVDLAKTYDPASVEQEVTGLWAQKRAFAATPNPDRPSYVIVIPPPNVTAALHIGHALNNTLQDVLIRHHRMLGDDTLWMPGTDHAGIATQTVVEKRVLAEEGKRRTDFERKAFVEKIQAWKDEYEAFITSQLKAMGCSCDWDRQRFTMDPVCAAAVHEAFFKLFSDGLIYRGKRLVNWDPATQTALADDEVEMQEIDGHFWYMKYPVVDEAGNETGEHVTVATTRPETMLGDTAVAVNPKDKANAPLIGKKVRLPIVGRVIPIIGDDYVTPPDPDSSDEKAKYSSGCLKVTPAHDPNDWDIGLRHNLDVINVMAPDGTISHEHGWDDWDACDGKATGPFLGLGREDARQAILAWFDTHGLLAETRPYRHAVGHSYRSHVPIEPYLSDQWYVKVTDDRLAGAALRAMTQGQRSKSDGCVWKEGDAFESSGGRWEGKLKFYPDRYAKTFQSWHENIRDWCISRQLWWGHRIPVWSAEDTPAPESVEQSNQASVQSTGEQTHVCLRQNDPKLVADLEAAGFAQDADVLDTWFSSGLWPISTLGWPNPETFADQIPEGQKALDAWNPGSVLCTAREIITLWVSRMVMFNVYFRDCLPFEDVFIHAMIQDGEGQKMSKSLGNGVDPLDIIHSHGADAMRFTLASMTTQTQDVRMPVDLVCPHCQHAFSPAMSKTSAGHMVASAEQTCPDCSKPMVSAYGVSLGHVKPTDDKPLARNTSGKFDHGRNFSNKIWNGGRFALGILEGGDHTAEPGPRSLSDRWILSRLANTIDAATEALNRYRYNEYTQCLYDFFWRELCDWYLEAIKPVVRENTPAGATARATLAASVDAILRLLHPVMPYVTEKLWQRLNDVAPDRSVDGLPLTSSPLCIHAAWPKVEGALKDDAVESQFESVRQAINVIREVRSSHQVPPKQTLQCRIQAPEGLVQSLTQAQIIFPPLCNSSLVQAATHVERGADEVLSTVGAMEIGLEIQADQEAEQERLTKRIAELQKSRSALEGRLANPKYVEKAPAHLVEQTRGDLEATVTELTTLEQKLQAPG